MGIGEKTSDGVTEIGVIIMVLLLGLMKVEDTNGAKCELLQKN